MAGTGQPNGELARARRRDRRREVDPTALDGTAYRFIRVLGRGGMGTVIECEHIGLARPVVVKLLHPEFAERPDFVDRLRIEAQALARMEHPNLVRVSDFGLTPGGVPFLAMEKLEGHTLAEELERRRYLPVVEALDLICQALDGLAAAHALGIVHRDVKPANLFLCDTPQGRRLKVLDFGIAKVLAEADLGGLAPKYRTQQGVRLGTPHYIAPEQLKGGLITPATDVYATGLVLYRLLVGEHPFAGAGSVDEVHQAQLTVMPPAPSKRAPQPLPHDLDRVVLRAVAKLPEDRFASAAKFAAALHAVLAGQALSPDSRWAATEVDGATLANTPLDAPPKTAASSPQARAGIAPPTVDIGARRTSARTQRSPAHTARLEAHRAQERNEPAAPAAPAAHVAASAPHAADPAHYPPAVAPQAIAPAAYAEPHPTRSTQAGSHRTAGAVCMVAAVLELVYQLVHVLFGLAYASGSFIEADLPNAVDGVTMVAEALIAGGLSVALAWIANRLIAGHPRAAQAAFTWSGWALVAVAVIFVLRIVGSFVALASTENASKDYLFFVVGLALVVPIVEGALVLWLRLAVKPASHPDSGTGGFR